MDKEQEPLIIGIVGKRTMSSEFLISDSEMAPLHFDLFQTSKIVDALQELLNPRQSGRSPTKGGPSNLSTTAPCEARGVKSKEFKLFTTVGCEEKEEIRRRHLTLGLGLSTLEAQVTESAMGFKRSTTVGGVGSEPLDFHTISGISGISSVELVDIKEQQD